MRHAPPYLVRRRFLAGMGTMLILPVLESVLPRAARAASDSQRPQRLVVVHTPNGRRMDSFTPSAVGNNWSLPPMLASLSKVKGHTLVLTGMQHDACIKSRALSQHDDPDLHALGLGTLFTGARLIARPKGAQNSASSISMEQLYANYLERTGGPKLSLQLGLVRSEADGKNSGRGFFERTMRDISYDVEGRPLDEVYDALRVFETHFAGAKNEDERAALAVKYRQRRSILDGVLSEANALQSRIGRGDAQRLDHYFTSVRALEQQLTAASANSCATPGANPVGLSSSDVRGQANTMMDLMVLAFQCDLTRSISYNFGVGHSHHKYDWVRENGLTHQIHDLSHFDEGGNPASKKAQKALTEAYEISVLARFWEGLQAIPEAGGSILDNSVTLAVSEVADSSKHTYDDTGYLVVGKGGGFIDTNRHVVAGKRGAFGNLTELQLAILQGLGVESKSFGGFNTTRAMTLRA